MTDARRGRGSLSMNRDVWDRLRARCEADGVSMSGRVEQLCEGIGWDLVVPRVPTPDAVPAMPPRIPPADRAVLDRIAALRATRGLPEAPILRRVQGARAHDDLHVRAPWCEGRTGLWSQALREMLIAQR